VTAAAAGLLVFPGCRRGPAAENVLVFNAAGISGLLEDLQPVVRQKLGLNLVFEASGSQVACRKLAELGRQCDLLIVADSWLIPEYTGAHCPWKIEFAHDAVVLAVGARARFVDEAEADWAGTLLRRDVQLARVDEALGPIGYRALLAWKLEELRGRAGLTQALLGKTVKIVDDVANLMPLLKSGDIDYAFAHRSTCHAHQVRYIALSREVDLSSAEVDYSRAEVSFEERRITGRKTVTVRGSPIAFALGIPTSAPHPDRAERLVQYVLSAARPALEGKGFVAVRPRFFGPREAFGPYERWADYAGPLEGSP